MFMDRASLTFMYVSEQFTLFELWSRFIFLVLTVFVIVLFSWRMRTYSWCDWTLEQKWTTLLLITLVAWNNPLFPMEIIVDHWFPVFLDIVMLVSFVVSLLLYWLVMFDGVYRTETQRSFFFYLPKVFLLLTIYCVIISSFTLLGLQELDDPSSTIDNMPNHLILQITMYVLLGIYGFYLLYVVFRSFGAIISGMEGTETNPIVMGVRIKFFFLFTLLILVITIAGLLLGFISPLLVFKRNASVFLTVLSLYNLYVFTLAFVYLPTQVANSSQVSDFSMQEVDLIELEDKNLDSARGQVSGDGDGGDGDEYDILPEEEDSL
eukprot:TRINITY_DN4672_c0_g1_i10.p1 TRINITY_DN4672_c0_g1~~TRINITY_DN4672_c0_g1_i10.p1  ORF type:complete len:321 (-),score=55.66 TRINITY_DN4672_c0_g1_i10:128-1090(-)